MTTPVFRNLAGCLIATSLSSLPAKAFEPAGMVHEAVFVVGGSAPVGTAFPATGEFTGKEICTGTAVGPQAVLTAAHCVPDDGKARITLDKKSVALVCKRHPEYGETATCSGKKDVQCSADVALCKAASKIAVGSSKYEVVQTDPSAVHKDAKIILVGYGCTSEGATDHGILHMGTATIAKTSNEKSEFLSDRYLLSKGGAVSCFGDSGAGNFDVADPSKRFVIAVSSRRMDTVGGSAFSAFVQTTDAKVIAFMRKWTVDSATKICGVNTDAVGCR